MKIKDYIKIANYLDEIGRTVEADNVMKHVTSQFQSPVQTGPKFQSKNPFALAAATPKFIRCLNKVTGQRIIFFVLSI